MSDDRTGDSTLGVGDDHRLPEPGLIIDGRYRIEEELGKGAFGRVHRATDLAAEREVALKLIGISFSSQRERVQREIRALQALRVEGVAHLLDDG